MGGDWSNASTTVEGGSTRASTAACFLTLLGLWLAACGVQTVEVVGQREAWAARSSLLIPQPPPEQLVTTGGAGAEIGYFKCDGGQQKGGGPRPGLRLPPPGELHLILPEDRHPRARLFIELGLEPGAHRRRGRREVRFEIELDGQLAGSATRFFGNDTQAAERLWLPLDVALGDARRLTLRSSLEQGARKDLGAVFASLELREPRAVSRTLSTADHPNIVYVVIDTLRADRLEPYGYRRPTSATLSKLAEDGTLF
ncbi:MAG: hypothetical protein QF724_02660 [Planctomycetota bacterium]|nr:hypothetical protein [Planctomycetota bacterium]MDP6519926.1 hypothetical protein [Planctomycetota bacterium]MDP6837812.1 hypothetical protein [Planctomycetota bacterium]